jgi:hypothetical protein
MFQLHCTWCHCSHLSCHPWWVLKIQARVLPMPYYVGNMGIFHSYPSRNPDQAAQACILHIPRINSIIKTGKAKCWPSPSAYCIYLPSPATTTIPLVQRTSAKQDSNQESATKLTPKRAAVAPSRCELWQGWCSGTFSDMWSNQKVDPKRIQKWTQLLSLTSKDYGKKIFEIMLFDKIESHDEVPPSCTEYVQYQVNIFQQTKLMYLWEEEGNRQTQREGRGFTVSNTAKTYTCLDLQMSPSLLSGALRFGKKKHTLQCKTCWWVKCRCWCT